jgi:hypothetical protein
VAKSRLLCTLPRHSLAFGARKLCQRHLLARLRDAAGSGRAARPQREHGEQSSPEKSRFHHRTSCASTMHPMRQIARSSHIFTAT